MTSLGRWPGQTSPPRTLGRAVLAISRVACHHLQLLPSRPARWEEVEGPDWAGSSTDSRRHLC